MSTINERTGLSALRCRVPYFAALAGLLALAGCGSGYREGEAAQAEAGSEAHGDAMARIARELATTGCGLERFDLECVSLGDELMQELDRCFRTEHCDRALASVENEADDVQAQLVVPISTARRKAVRERSGRRWGLTPIRR